MRLPTRPEHPGSAVVATATLALFIFVAGIIFPVRLDRETAALDNAIDLIEAALKETER